MKTIKYLISIILLGIMSMICSCTESSQAMPKQGHDGFYSQVNFDKIEESSDEEAVYICTGPSSKRYHKSSDCMGLSSCSADIERVTKSYAEELGRTPLQAMLLNKEDLRMLAIFKNCDDICSYKY